jgi:vanillate O-demethylase monooxygenase subunit
MFAKNCWYAAAWSFEISHHPLGRILLDEPVVFFRTRAGEVVAMQDRCPHRGYPLHKGRLLGDTLECGYHGMTFDCAGKCVRVPGQRQIPSGSDLRTFPIVERWGLVWLWPGNPSLADPRSIPDCPRFDDPVWDARGEHLNVSCDYRLIIDNLLDLSHIAFVHPRTLGSSAKLDEVEITNEITDNSVAISRWLLDIAPPPTYARGNFKGNVDRWQITNFQPPAFVGLWAGARPTGSSAPKGDPAGGIGLYTINLMTPESDKTTHYFWGVAQDRAHSDDQLIVSIFHDIQKTVQEDIAVFEAQQRSLDLAPDAPMIALKSDAGPLAARRIIDRIVDLEHTVDKRKRA